MFMCFREINVRKSLLLNRLGMGAQFHRHKREKSRVSGARTLAMVLVSVMLRMASLAGRDFASLSISSSVRQWRVIIGKDWPSRRTRLADWPTFVV
jgi:hypothetical protein